MMGRRLLPACAALVLALLSPAAAQPVEERPFDMTPERPAGGSVATPPAEAEPARPATLPEAAPATADQGRRFILPAPTLRLDGEVASRTLPVFLTERQAQAVRAIHVGYTNAVVIAPEASALTVTVNGVTVGSLPIRSAAGVEDVRFDMPRGLLRAGANQVTFSTSQRHRTDCTIQSTYDLWTDLDAAHVYLDIEGDAGDEVPTLDDLAAIGVDAAGLTRFVLVAPELDQRASTASLLRLAQALALTANMPNQSFEVVRDLPSQVAANTFVAVLGTSADLAERLPGLPAAAGGSAFTGFVPRAGGGHVFVVTGPGWAAIDEAVERLVTPLERPIVPGVAQTTVRGGVVDIPLLLDQTSLSFSSLGVSTGEFGGRRFRTGFDIGIPSDFYADAYGEATLLLDAAYSAEVQPGSHIDVYVNGNIATTVPITTRKGGLFRQLPIRVTMRHFRPGANRIDIEAVLMTEADAVCAPGAPARNDARFALFDTSAFRMPRFARIGQLPDLAALAGRGFPYARQQAPVALYLDRLDPDRLSAGATFLGKLAFAGQRPVALRPEASALSIGEEPAILIGAVSQIPAPVLEQVHVAAESATGWGSPQVTTSPQAGTDSVLDEWQSRLRGSSWRGQVSAFEQWLKETFDISLSSLRLLPHAETPVLPPDSARLLVAQGDSPGATAPWTLITAPDGAALHAGMEALSKDAAWRQLDGFASLEAKDGTTLDVRPATRLRFVGTQPLSFGNLRLVAANWMSSNILVYAGIFCLLAGLLGLSTALLLRLFGRKG
ncbi:cellulose biosynthesis cyclic di-GMP-binding regulatory protein BcsB [Ensifer soli]|uniref:cellulose biosynthesis cyclic di-GMP-binding regulatory protein BcsB n=1 Tax=Ciceribacter sp. sgz301302 TaxID=3342379 RepID=UPI0035B6F83D